PIVTYIMTKILYTMNNSHSTNKKVKGIFLSGIASAMTYIVTHNVFGFGIPEASAVALVAAFVLGSLGFSA
ncbi:MAG: hypothetical protein JXQ76_01445, partial [Campylobacterales bacterium]|nr:hypothetical protein [Campylobacterales bacterium]